MKFINQMLTSLIVVFGTLVGSQALAGSICTGGNYRVETTGNYVTVYTNNIPSFQGIPQLTKVWDGHNYHNVNPNVGPRPQDIIIENSFVVPQFTTGSIYYSYLDARISTIFPVPSASDNRTTLLCQAW